MPSAKRLLLALRVEGSSATVIGTLGSIHGLYTFYGNKLHPRDAATRRNLLFRSAAQRLRDHPPATPIVAAGVTSAAPALAELLRTIADLPNGAVVLPDLDLGMVLFTKRSYRLGDLIGQTRVIEEQPDQIGRAHV